MGEAKGTDGSGDETKLLILIARTEESFDPVVTALLDAGITGATILESRGLGAIIRSEMPIFAGLAALLPHATGSRVILSVATQSSIDALMRFVGQLPREQRPIGVTMPATTVLGLEP